MELMKVRLVLCLDDPEEDFLISFVDISTHGNGIVTHPLSIERLQACSKMESDIKC